MLQQLLSQDQVISPSLFWVEMDTIQYNTDANFDDNDNDNNNNNNNNSNSNNNNNKNNHNYVTTTATTKIRKNRGGKKHLKKNCLEGISLLYVL